MASKKISEVAEVTSLQETDVMPIGRPLDSTAYKMSVGTLLDHITTLIPQGTTGAKGDTGEPGAKGDKGDTGGVSSVNGQTGDVVLDITGTNSVDGEGIPIKPTYFGSHIEKIEAGSTPAITPYHFELGFKTLRLWDTETCWNNIEQTKGVFQWALMDSYVNTALANGIEILYCLGQPPKWANPANPLVTNPYAFTRAPHPPLDIQDWRDYVSAVVTRYQGKIKAYEIWNEPNYDLTYLGTVDELATLTREAYTIIKSIDPAALVVSASPTAFSGVSYLESMLATDMKDYIDVVGIHLYCYPSPPETMIELAQSYKTVIKNSGLGDIPVWNTEVTYNAVTDFDGNAITNINGQSYIKAPDDLAISYIARMYLCGLVGGMERTYLYGHDYPWGILRILDWDDTTIVTGAGFAYQRVVSWLAGSNFIKYMNNGKGLHGILIKDAAGVNKLILWAEDNQQFHDILPLARTIDECTTITGVTSIPTEFVVTHNPVMIKLDEGNDSRTLSGMMASATTTGSGQEILFNGDFKYPRLTNSTQIPGWSCVNPTTSYVGDDSPVGTSPVTISAVRQYQGLRQYIKTIPSGAKYRISLTYKLPESQVNEWLFRLEYGRLGSAYASSNPIWISQSDEFVTATQDFYFPKTSKKQPTDVKLVIVNVKASGWNPIHVASASLSKITEGNEVASPVNVTYADDYPTNGDFLSGDQVWFSNAAAIQAYGLGVVCIGQGTFGTLTGVTGSINAGSGSLVVNSTDDISPGNILTIGGEAGSFLVSDVIPSTNTVLLSTTATGNRVASAIAFKTPTFNGLGFTNNANGLDVYNIGNLTARTIQSGVLQAGADQVGRVAKFTVADATTSWRLAATIVFSPGTYRGIAIAANVTGAFYSGTVDISGRYIIWVNRSDAADLDKEQATIIGTDTSNVRVIKTQVGDVGRDTIYELQYRQAVAWRDTTFEFSVISYADNLNCSVTWATTPMDGNTIGTIYLPTRSIKNNDSILVGTSTNDNAAAGIVGEYIQALVAAASARTITTDTALNIASISLGAGDWDIEGCVNFAGTTATVTDLVGGISTTTATIPADGSEVYSGTKLTTTTFNDSIVLPRKRISLSGTTIVYLVAKSIHSAGTVKGFGYISGRRVR